MMKKILAGILIVLLGACSAGISRELAKGDRKLAVLSFAGGQFHALENVRPSSEAMMQRWKDLDSQLPLLDRGYDWNDILDISQTRRWQHEVAAWGIDSFVVSATTAALSPKYEIVPFKQGPADLGFEGFYSFEGDEYADKVADIIRAQPGYAAAKDVDAYIVVLPSAWLLMGRERHSYGIGLFKTFRTYGAENSFEEGSIVLHALYYVMVLDGRTLKMIAGSVARDDEDSRWHIKGHPGKFVDPTYWAADYDALLPGQAQKLTEALEGLIKDSLPSTLTKVGLLP